MPAKNGARSGSLPSDVTGMYGAATLMMTTNCASVGACAIVCESPQPKAFILRLLRAASICPVTGVRFTQTMSRVSPDAFVAHASKMYVISAEPYVTTPDDRE